MLEGVKKFISEKFVPSAQKFSSNAYVSGIQKAVIKIIPMILVSSVVTIYGIVQSFISGLPDLSPISNYSFGLVGMMTAYLIPYYILDSKRDSRNVVAGITGLGLFMMALKPEAVESGFLYNFDRFGAQGMLVSMIIGLFVVVIFNLAAKIKLIGEDSPLPEFCKEWFNCIIPIFIIFLVGTIIIYACGFSLFDAILSLFNPLMNLTASYWGGLIMLMLQVFVYTLGISCWIFDGIIIPISNAALQANMAAAAAGATLPYVFTYGFDFAYVLFGGVGATLPLIVYFIFSKSKRLKLLGKVYAIPTLLNINEPVMYGNIAWNPLLMPAPWLCTFVNYSLAYLSIHLGLLAAPVVSSALWFLPYPLPSFILGGIKGAILCIVLIAIDFVIWYPFFKAYEVTTLKEEEKLEGGKNKHE
ncbi:PTS transporter subunit EIIC [Holdemania massiliensis]|nr:PTS transporter subunit EIIC [Holdemania massiliensis]